MLSTIIFSKDRPAQVDLCLKSFNANASALDGGCYIGVVYAASTGLFQSGYDVIKREHREYYFGVPQVFWYGETYFGGFVKAFEEAMKHSSEYVLFLTDDDIVYRHIETDLMAYIDRAMRHDPELLTVSLRLGKNTFVQDHYNNSICSVPDEVNNTTKLLREWNWKDSTIDNNFYYPFSLDGHLFRKGDVQLILNGVPGWYNPNSMEGKAQHFIRTMSGLGNKMACFEHSYVVNTPLNRVQDTCLNRAGEFFPNSPEELNEEVLRGKRLSLNKMDFSSVIGCHQEIKLEWEPNVIGLE